MMGCCRCPLTVGEDPAAAKFSVVFGSITGGAYGYSGATPVTAGNWARQNWSVATLPSYYTAVLGEKFWRVNPVPPGAPDPGVSEAPELRRIWSDAYGNWYWGGMWVMTPTPASSGDVNVWAEWAMQCQLWFPADGRSPVLVVYRSATSVLPIASGAPSKLYGHPTYPLTGDANNRAVYSCAMRAVDSDASHPLATYPLGSQLVPQEAYVDATIGTAAPQWYTGSITLTFRHSNQRSSTDFRMVHRYSTAVTGGQVVALYHAPRGIAAGTYLALETVSVDALGNQTIGSTLTTLATWDEAGEAWVLHASVTSLTHTWHPADNPAHRWPCIGNSTPLIQATGADGHTWSAASKTLDARDQMAIVVTRA